MKCGCIALKGYLSIRRAWILAFPPKMSTPTVIQSSLKLGAAPKGYKAPTFSPLSGQCAVQSSTHFVDKT